MPAIDSKRIVSTDSPSMLRIRAALEQHGPMNGRALCELAHVAFNTFQNCYRHILLAEQKIHLHAWEHNHRGPFVPVYAAGQATGKPPKKPKKIDQLERARNWKVRSGYNEARKAERRMKRPPDAVMRALMGCNAELSGPRPLAAEGSRSNDVLERTADKEKR